MEALPKESIREHEHDDISSPEYFRRKDLKGTWYVHFYLLKYFLHLFIFPVSLNKKHCK